MRDVELVDVEISGEVENLVVNGVDVAPLVRAELERRDPDYAKMRPTDADGFREAFATLERLWEGTVAKARTLTPEQQHASVDGEWSFVQTLRHLAFASECWVGRQVLGDPQPWQPLSLPWGGMSDTPGVPNDVDARPTLDEALAVRGRAQTMVRDHLAGLTEEELDRVTEVRTEPGHPRDHAFTVRECLLVVLNEEWWHRQYAERDLAVLLAQ